MLRLALALVLAGCWTSPPPAAPPVANRAPTTAVRTLGLPVIPEPCGNGTDGCAQDPLIIATMIARRDVADCDLATRVQLRGVMSPTASRLCHVVLATDGRPAWFVDVGLLCELHGQDPRATIARATCAGGALEVELIAGDVTHRAACTPGKGSRPPRCTRTALPVPADEGLAAFLARVARAAEGHDWQALLALAAAEHRAAQIDQLGMTEPAYLAELLGLHYVGNSLDGDDVGVTLDKLATIAKLEPTDVAATGRGTFDVTGWVTLTTGVRLRLTLHVTREAGRFALFGALG